MTDDYISSIIYVYCMFGLLLAILMFLRATLLEFDKPVTANFSAFLGFCFVASELTTTVIWVHTLKALWLCGPMAIIAFLGGLYCMKELAKIMKAGTKAG